jgi:hypothetical protein
MAEVNLNFHNQTSRYNPTERELCQIEGLAVSVDAIIKTLAEYAENTNHSREDIGGVCLNVCNALELLMAPVIEYLCNYAGNVPTPEGEADHAS